MKIPILNGIYTDQASDFRVSYPRNLMPVPMQQGISAGYLRPADGLVSGGTGPGIGRGGINWNGELYRVMGTKLVKIASDNTYTVLGDVGGTTHVTFDYSFDRLAIASNNNLFYWDGTTLTQVTDPDLGNVADMIWVDGYFMTTDGTFLVVTELNDPTAVNPLKYGSAEADPDPIKALLKLRNEVYALNRYTVEVFDNVGGDLFPFARIEGAQMQRGTVGTHACCVFMENIVFVGGGRNEAPAVWMGSNAQTQKISSREIDTILSGYSEDQLETIVMEARVDKGVQHLYIHLPDQTLVFDGSASEAFSDRVWFTLTSSLFTKGQYKARDFVWCYDKWNVNDPTSTKYGYTSDQIATHYGERIGWDFGTSIVFNETSGAIFHSLELVCLTGRNALGNEPYIWTQYSTDGETWSQERMILAGKQGNRNKRLLWLQQGAMRNWRIQRFRGTSDSMLSIAHLEARIEPLAY